MAERQGAGTATATATANANATAPAVAPTAASTRTASAVRPEIQALRAVAVLGVVLFHLWPDSLTGGYAGVDVFFVISGFLITSHLAKEVAATGRVGLTRFWARRIRRLLPAALTVLAITAVATYVWVPRTLWPQHLWEIIASATYWQNWRLTAEAVDYLGAENAPSSVEHYWSLSVEEQFYLVWPLLLVCALALSRRLNTGHTRTFVAILAAVGTAGLAASIVLTASNPAAAYFVTPTRVWEFAAGGLLAFLGAAATRAPARARVLVAGAGWIAILATFALYTTATPFPGWTALLPVAGTAAVIWAGTDSRGALARVVGWRPVQHTGDVSYSLYLWHWPLIVIVPYATGRDLSAVDAVAILAASFALAEASKRLLEDPVRTSAVLRQRPGLTYGLGAAAMALTVALALWGILAVRADSAESERRTTQLLADTERSEGCFGAAAALGSRLPCYDAALERVLLPAPAAIKGDTGGAYECYDETPGGTVLSCTVGSTAEDATRVALAGNSHAASLLPGLSAQLRDSNWTLDTYLSRGCTWQDPADAADPCAEHRAALATALEEGDYDIIIVAERRSLDLPAGAPNPTAVWQARAWERAIDAGATVVAVADNPAMTDEALACLADATGPDDAAGCGVSRDEGLGTSDPLIEAVELTGRGAHLVDYTDMYCGPTWCPATIGHAIVYRDTHHLTATFSRTLGPYLVADVERMVASP